MKIDATTPALSSFRFASALLLLPVADSVRVIGLIALRYTAQLQKCIPIYRILNSGHILNKTEIKLKQNNFAETKHCFAFVLFQFYIRCNHCIIRISSHRHKEDFKSIQQFKA